jgi:hypothetical protein
MIRTSKKAIVIPAVVVLVLAALALLFWQLAFPNQFLRNALVVPKMPKEAPMVTVLPSDMEIGDTRVTVLDYGNFRGNWGSKYTFSYSVITNVDGPYDAEVIYSDDELSSCTEACSEAASPKGLRYVIDTYRLDENSNMVTLDGVINDWYVQIRVANLTNDQTDAVKAMDWGRTFDTMRTLRASDIKSSHIQDCSYCFG